MKKEGRWEGGREGGRGGGGVWREVDDRRKRIKGTGFYVK